MAAKAKKASSDDSEATIRVRALEEGYYGHLRRREGDVFDISAETYPADVVRVNQKTKETTVVHRAGDVREFSERWMERVSPKTPIQLSTVGTQMRREHDEILSAKAGLVGSVGAPTGDQNVLGD